jgi:hypothetical protein
MSIAQSNNNLQEAKKEILECSSDGRSEHSRMGLTGEGFRLNDVNGLQAGYMDLFKNVEFSSFIGLSYRDDQRRGFEAVVSQIKRFIKLVNIQAFGKHYTRIVHHSYFSYLLALEAHQSGEWHAHMLVDRPINFHFWISTWWNWSGYITIKKIEDRPGALQYCLKYAAKGGMIYPYIAKPDIYLLHPLKRPIWWIERQSSS